MILVIGSPLKSSVKYQPSKSYPSRVGVGNVTAKSSIVNLLTAPAGNVPSFNS